MSNSVTPRSRRKTVLLSGTALVAAAAATVLSVNGANAEDRSEGEAAQPEAAECALEQLPIPEGQYFSIVTGMSEDGSAIAYRTYDPDSYQRDTWVYADGQATLVELPGKDQSLSDVNSALSAVGDAFEDGGTVPYVWSGGELSGLPIGDYEYGTAEGINENGEIVGGLGEFDESVPVIWSPGGDGPTELELPEGATWGVATDIDEDGTIVGQYGYGEDNSRPFVLHTDGTVEALPLPDGVDEDSVGSYPMDISGDWVSGYLFDDEIESGMRWNLAEGTAEMLDQVLTPAVNIEGTAAGETFPHATYQTADGEPVELPGLSDPADNYFGDTATEINEDGTLMAGQVYAGEDEDGIHILKAVTWTCE